jgi:hypothetical protein
MENGSSVNSEAGWSLVSYPLTKLTSLQVCMELNASESSVSKNPRHIMSTGNMVNSWLSINST